jgi:hypothetical protein
MKGIFRFGRMSVTCRNRATLLSNGVVHLFSWVKFMQKKRTGDGYAMLERIIGKAVGTAFKGLVIHLVKEGYRRKKQKEIEEKTSFVHRGLVMTILIYLLGFLFSYWLLSFGTWGIVLVILGFLGHLHNLNEAKQYGASITRELTLSIMSMVALAVSFFI